MGILWKDQLNNTFFDVWLHKQINARICSLIRKLKRVASIENHQLLTLAFGYKRGFNELRSGDNRGTCEYSWLFEK